VNGRWPKNPSAPRGGKTNSNAPTSLKVALSTDTKGKAWGRAGGGGDESRFLNLAKNQTWKFGGRNRKGGQKKFWAAWKLEQMWTSWGGGNGKTNLKRGKGTAQGERMGGDAGNTKLSWVRTKSSSREEDK